MAKNHIQFSHRYPAAACSFQQTRLARLARALSLASESAQLSPRKENCLTRESGNMPQKKNGPKPRAVFCKDGLLVTLPQQEQSHHNR
jgi:hypothetical protein